MSNNPYKGHAKCLLCLKDTDADANEKEVIVFPQFGVCICDFHLRKMISEYLEIEPSKLRIESENKE